MQSAVDARQPSGTKRCLLIVVLAVVVTAVVGLGLLLFSLNTRVKKPADFSIPQGVPYVNRSLECTSPLQLPGHQGNRSFINLGQVTAEAQYPWVAKIIISTDQYKSFCGGTILDTRHVLTAGHCFKPIEVHDNETQSFITNTRAIKVYVGARRFLDDSWNYRQSGMAAEVSVETVYVHPAYNRTWYGMTDVAVIRLAEALQLSDHVAPVCLASLNDTLPEICIAVGWGRNAESELISHVQNQAFLKSYTKEDCKKFEKELRAQSYGGDMDKDLAGMLCTRSDEQYPGNTCQGDSGGPLLCEPQGSNSTALKQFGLTSFSFTQTCGPPNRINAYIWVAQWRFWLQDFILPLLADDLHPLVDDDSTTATNATTTTPTPGVTHYRFGPAAPFVGSARQELAHLTVGCRRIPSLQMSLTSVALRMRDPRHLCPIVATFALCWKRRGPQNWQDCEALLPVLNRAGEVAYAGELVRDVACHPFILNCTTYFG